MTVLVIDVGSSSVRTLLVDDELVVIPGSVVRMPYQFHYDAAGAAEISALWLRHQVEHALDQVLQHPAASTISAVGMTTFVANLVGVSSTNQPLTPIYTYADARAAEYVDALKNEIDTVAAYNRTGCPNHSVYHPVKLRWLYEQHPKAASQVTTWMDFGTYCYRTWFGNDAPCSYSMASWTGLLDRVQLVWDGPWLDVLNIGVERFPVLADFDAVQTGLVQDYRKRWPLLADVPFCLPIGDGAAANVGCGGVDRSRVVLTVGTTAALRVVTDEKEPDLPQGLWNYHVTGPHHLIGGATIEGGNIFDWASRTLKLDAEKLELNLSTLRADQHGLTVLPMLAGERSPGYAVGAVGTVHGLRITTQPVDVLQAMLESVALRLSLIMDMLTEPGTPVYASGGALAGSAAWTQMMANALNHDIYLLVESEGTARGMAILATGQMQSAPLPAIERVFHPDPQEAAALRAARDRQQALYKTFYS